MSFYFWRTVFSMDSLERATLRANGVHTLYTRYFDVDWPEAGIAPVPVAPLRFGTPPGGYTIIPVVYIRDRVFEKLSPEKIPAFAAEVFALVSRIDSSGSLRPKEIQFDCDWSEGTKDHYFAFLKQYRLLSRQTLSATIRLHQVKYPERTGVPPVDYGVLMYYNIGHIDTGAGRSIYEKTIAQRYMPALPVYPLTLDIALPVFSWGLQVRDNKVIRLLDNMNAGNFSADSNFTGAGANRFNAAHACFKSGYYFRAGDGLKIESVPPGDLLEMIRSVNRYSNHRIRNLIFYDLDQENLLQYDKNVFKEILDHTD